MIINHNLNAMNAHRNMAANNTATGKSMEKLSSGLRINRAGDDAAGLAISEKMRAQVRGLDQASRNAQDGISLIQTAEGALNETHSILQRIRELSVQSGNDTNQDAVDRDAIQTETTALLTEIDRIATDTQFNGKTLLNGTIGTRVDNTSTAIAVAGVTNINSTGAQAGTYSITSAGGVVTVTSPTGATIVGENATDAGGAQTINFTNLGFSITTNSAFVQDSLNGSNIVVTGTTTDLQIGANAGQTVSVSINDMSVTGLGLTGINLANKVDAQSATTRIANAINLVSTQRSNLGALQNRLEHTIANLDNASENLQSSESRIRDVDMAKEMTIYSKNNILTQAAQAMLAQAKSQPESVLQLLR